MSGGVNVGTAYLEIIPSAAGFGNRLTAQLSGDMGRAGEAAGTKASGGFASTFGSGLKAMAGAAAALGIASAVTGFIGDSIAEAREAQKVGAVTEQIIKATGGAAKVTAGQVGDLATAISLKTGVDDEAIQTGANLLLTFKKVRNEVGAGNQIFDRATAAALDLSKAGFGSMDSASKMLGKALNDPVQGITALSRAGVTFTEQQKEQIKTLARSGKTLEAQKLILAEVESQVGGTAAASATAGEKMAVAWGNVQEKVGEKLLPILDKAAGFVTEKILPAVTKFVDAVSDPNSDAGATIGKISSALSSAGQVMTETVVPAARQVWEWIQKHVVPAVKDLAEKLSSGLQAAWKTVTEKINENRPALEAIGRAIKAVAEFITDKAAPIIGTVLKAAFELVGEGIGRAIDVVGYLVEAFQTLARWGVWLWNNVLLGVTQKILGGFSMITRGIAVMLDALGNIPGFEWAKDAARKMEGAAGWADRLGENLGKLPDPEIIVTARFNDQFSAPFARAMNTANATNKYAALDRVDGYRAAGGPVTAGRAYVVGEHRPELFVPNTSGTILPSVPSGSPSTLVVVDSDGQVLMQMRTAAASSAVAARAGVREF